LAFWRFFSGRGLATRLGLLQGLPRRSLRRLPRRALPPVRSALVGETVANLKLHREDKTVRSAYPAAWQSELRARLRPLLHGGFAEGMKRGF
jgi:hypothetical protein